MSGVRSRVLELVPQTDPTPYLVQDLGSGPVRTSLIWPVIEQNSVRDNEEVLFLLLQPITIDEYGALVEW
jgi:hypothetical protein